MRPLSEAYCHWWDGRLFMTQDSRRPTLEKEVHAVPAILPSAPSAPPREPLLPFDTPTPT